MHSNRDGLAVAGLASILSLLFLFNSGWELMTPAGQIDPYIFTGYMRDLGELKQGAYQSSRLPWILTGYVSYALFSPLVASTMLRIGLWLTATVALYFCVKKLTHNEAAAFGAAALMGLHSYFLDAIRTDYVDGPCIAVTLVVLALLLQGKVWLIPLAGFFAMCLVSMNLSAATLLPLFAGAGIYGLRDVRKVAWAVPLALSGAALCFLLFGLINQELVGQFNYLELQFEAARTLNADIYRPPDWRWLEHAYYLTLPALLLLLTAPATVLLPRLRPAYALFVPVALLFIVAQLAGGVPLSTPWYASLLIPFSFIVVGALLAQGNKVLIVSTVAVVVSLGVGIPVIDVSWKAQAVYDLDTAVWRYNENGKLYYWYNINEPGTGHIYNGAAALRGWYSRLISQNFPDLSNPVFEGVTNEPPVGIPIAIISYGAVADRLAVDVLAKRGLAVEVIGRGSIQGPVFYTVIRAVPAGRTIPLPLTDLVYASPASKGPGQVVTGPLATGGGAYLVLPRTDNAGGFVRVKLNVHKAPVDVCVLSRDSTYCLAEQEIYRPGPIELVLKVADLDKAGFVTFRGASVGGEGVVAVEDVSLTLPES